MAVKFNAFIVWFGVLCFVLLVLGVETWTSHMLSRHSANKLESILEV